MEDDYEFYTGLTALRDELKEKWMSDLGICEEPKMTNNKQKVRGVTHYNHVDGMYGFGHAFCRRIHTVNEVNLTEDLESVTCKHCLTAVNWLNRK